MSLTLNIINAKSERTPTLLAELDKCGITDYKLWGGVRLPSIKKSINRAHKQIVEWAYENNLDEVCIAEDDLKATHPDSWKYFLSQKPKDYDLYLSSVFLGDIDENKKVKEFTAPTLYFVSKKFYVPYLLTNDDEHIDHALAGLGDYHVCVPFTFIQHNGISSNTGKYETYDSLFQNRVLYYG